MLIKGNRFLNSTKINLLVRTLADQLEMQANLIFLNRTEVTNANESDILGKYKGQVFAADIIADGAEAVTYETGSFEFTGHTVPNIKIGAALTQGDINRLEQLSRTSTPMGMDIEWFTNWENMTSETLVMGLRQRINTLICWMQLDSAPYSRMGIDLSGSSWGMPSDLKVTSSTPWTTAASATPITDMQLIVTQVGPDSYGEIYDRVTMSFKNFRLMTQTTEFLNRVKGSLRYAFGTNELNINDTGAMLQLAADIVGVQIEVYDGTYWERSNNGAKTRQRVLPVNKVIFSNRGDDNNRQAMDFANGVVTESVVGSMLGMGGFTGPSYGPVSYWTASPDMNPPEVKCWSVMRGWPRKIRETATAVLTTGNYTS